MRRCLAVCLPLLCSFLLCHVSAQDTTDDTSTASNPKCRGLLVQEFLGFLQTEVTSEFDLNPAAVERLGMDLPQLLGRAQGMWDSATKFQYRRSLRDEPTLYPFLLCSIDENDDTNGFNSDGTVQRTLSGWERRQIVAEAIANAGGGDNIVLMNTFNSRGKFCAVASLPNSVATSIDFDGCVVQPMLLATKLGIGTIDLAVGIINRLANGTDFELEANEDIDDLVTAHVDPEETEDSDLFDESADMSFPGMSLSLCPGVFAKKDKFGVVSGNIASADEVSRIMTKWVTRKVGGFTGDTGADNLGKNVYWTGGSTDGSTSGRGDFWTKLVSKISGSEDSCAETFEDRLSWTLQPGFGEATYTNIHVTYNNLGASETDNTCILAMIAGMAVNPNTCFIELILPKSLQAEHDTSKPNADWITQSYIHDENPFFDNGINGTGVVVAVSDTGIDLDNCYFLDNDHEVGPDHRKVIQYYQGASDSSDYQGGHGTHVAGILAGKRWDSPGKGDGVAPGARLVFFDTMDYQTPRYPSDYELVTVGRDGVEDPDKVRIHSASWGNRGQNLYTAQAAFFDSYMYANDDYLMVFAAGNDGRGNKMDSVLAPSTSKNGISVGSVNSVPEDLKAVNAGIGYVADFSSKGVTGDGRISPDILAVGKFLLSAGAQPDEFGECDPADGSLPEVSFNKFKEGLKYDGGTSMAAPVVSGTAAIIIQYFEEGFYPGGERNSGPSISPSGALLKAILMNGARTDEIYGVDNNERGLPIAEVSPYDGNVGFGQINLLSSLYLKGKSFVQTKVWDREVIAYGEEKTYEVKIDKANGCSSEVFFTTLVWMEPGSPAYCNRCMLNDLDLFVTKNGGDLKYYPNGRSTKDDVNTVERVSFEDGVSDGDNFTIHVVAENLITQDQQFALVATGCFGGVESEYIGRAVGEASVDASKEEEAGAGGGTSNAVIIAISVVGGLAALGCIGLFVWKAKRNKESY